MNAKIEAAGQPLALTITLLGGGTLASGDSTILLLTGLFSLRKY